MHKKQVPRLLVCTLPEMLDAAINGLGHHYDCRFALTLNDACAQLDAKPDAILCNIHFDDGRLFEFVSYVRSRPDGRTVPFVISQSRETLTPSMIKGVKEASRALGIEAFVEIFRWREQYGIEEADNRVRATVDAVIAKRRHID
jgi:CheY-like chemotaxis protein